MKTMKITMYELLGMIEDGRYYVTDTLDDLYDLIKADLVEKVEE